MARKLTRSQRLAAAVRASAPFAHRADHSLTPVRAEGGTASAVHLGWDCGSYDSVPMCGALAARATETTDDPANCADCAYVVRQLGLGDLLRDEGGWTGIYQPRTR